MLWKRNSIAVELFSAAAFFWGTSGIASAGDHCVNRPGVSRGYRPSHGFGLFKKDPYVPGSQPQRFYDSTGRWTGDGVDTMSTARPVPQNAPTIHWRP